MIWCVLLLVLVYAFLTSQGPFYSTLTLFPQLGRIHPSDVLHELQTAESSLWKQWPEPLAYPDHRWKTIPLFGFGQWSYQSQHFPTLCRRLKQIPGVRLAILSKLEAGVSLQSHEGWGFHSNHVLRNHLPIVLPENKQACKIFVQPSRQHTSFQHSSYTDGQWITFDDSLPHFAINHSQQDRIVLIVDMERPPHIPRGTSTSQETEELKDFIQQNKAPLERVSLQPFGSIGEKG
jgi:aspartyl/asparaginyl beta-hydroxylase (cupin superfamily)